MGRIQGIVFDLDGTLIDTETPDYLAWQEIYEHYGIPLTPQLWATRTGMSAAATNAFDPQQHLAQHGITLSPDEHQAHIKKYMQRCHEQPLMPGAMDIIRYAQAHDIKMSVASNSDRQWVTYWLDYYQLTPYLMCVYTRDDVVHPKPAPDMYLAAVEGMKVPLERCIAIEDSSIGMRAAIAAGLYTIGIPNWLTRSHAHPQGLAMKVNALTDLNLADVLGD